MGRSHLPRLPRVKRVTKPSGLTICYHRAPGGALTRLSADPETDAQAHAEWLAADGSDRAPRSARSLDALADRYLASPAFRAMRAVSQGGRRSHVKAIIATTVKGRRYGDRGVAGLRAEHIAADLASQPPGVQRNRWKAWRALTAHGAQIGWMDDVGLSVRGPRPPSEPFRAWTPDDVARFRARWPVGTRQRLALELLYDLAPRRADLVTLGPQHMRAGRIAWRQSKTGDMTTPVRPAPETLEAIAAAPPGLLWLATEQGRARTPAGFGVWFREACDKAGLHGLSAHGLRHTLGADAAMSGDGAINALLGHRSDSPEAATYRAQAAAMAMADEARERIRAARMETGVATAAVAVEKKGAFGRMVGPEGLKRRK
jgi:integrase